MIGSFSILDLVILAVLWFFMSAISNLLWMRIVTLRYVGKALINWLNGLEKDKDGQMALSKLFLSMITWAGSAQIRTGNKVKIKQDDGSTEEIEEILTPIDLFGRRIGALIFAKVRSGTGGTKAALGRILEDEAAASGGISPTALRELSKGRYGPAIMELAMPHIQKKLINKRGTDTTSDNGGWEG